MTTKETKLYNLEIELVKYQKELIIVNKRRRFLRDIIKDYADKIDNMKDPIINSQTETAKLIGRDLDLVIDFMITEGRQVTSREVYDHLNIVLSNETVRWKQGHLDGNIFMGAIGNYMKRSEYIIHEKIGQHTYWTLTDNYIRTRY